ncbi:hypothetical protein Ct9H90mP29_04990 [bacterium]|nr:MAG: hypothetical protein Ct9H90mP29_04990 [bacterium]
MPDFYTWMKFKNSVLRHMTVVFSENLSHLKKKSRTSDEKNLAKDTENVEVE